MPSVGMRHFAYSKKGVKAASAYAKKTGLEMVSKKHEVNRKPHGSKVRKNEGTAVDESQNYVKLRKKRMRNADDGD